MRSPKIFYFCLSHQKPTGGNKKIYHHVDLLNAQGWQAYVLHFKSGFRLDWFPNQTPVVYLPEFERLYDIHRDILVLPEDLGVGILKFPGRKVIFNQNIITGFSRLGYRNYREPIPYLHPSVIGAIAVSEHNRTQLQLAYPKLPVFRVFCGIDGDRFQFQPLGQKYRQIAANLGKNPPEVLSLYQILRARTLQQLNGLTNWSWVWIEQKSEAEVAQILKESAVFISLSLHEGFGLLPLEAMASGCLVVAYGREPMTEYLPQEMQVRSGDLTEAVNRVETFVETALDRQDLAHTGCAIARIYSPEREQQSVLDTWDKLLYQVKHSLT